MSRDLKNLYLITQSDLRKIRKLTSTLERALIELVELKRVVTFDDLCAQYPPHECDLIEDASIIEYQFDLFKRNTLDSDQDL